MVFLWVFPVKMVMFHDGFLPPGVTTPLQSSAVQTLASRLDGSDLAQLQYDPPRNNPYEFLGKL